MIKFNNKLLDILFLSYTYFLNNNMAEVFNVLSNTVNSVNDLAKMILNIIGITPIINHETIDRSDP